MHRAVFNIHIDFEVKFKIFVIPPNVHKQLLLKIIIYHKPDNFRSVRLVNSKVRRSVAQFLCQSYLRVHSVVLRKYTLAVIRLVLTKQFDKTSKRRRFCSFSGSTDFSKGRF